MQGGKEQPFIFSCVRLVSGFFTSSILISHWRSPVHIVLTNRAEYPLFRSGTVVRVNTMHLWNVEGSPAPLSRLLSGNGHRLTRTTAPSFDISRVSAFVIGTKENPHNYPHTLGKLTRVTGREREIADNVSCHAGEFHPDLLLDLIVFLSHNIPGMHES